MLLRYVDAMLLHLERRHRVRDEHRVPRRGERHVGSIRNPKSAADIILSKLTEVLLPTSRQPIASPLS
jgi:hypothetical protein